MYGSLDNSDSMRYISARNRNPQENSIKNTIILTKQLIVLSDLIFSFLFVTLPISAWITFVFSIITFIFSSNRLALFLIFFLALFLIFLIISNKSFPACIFRKSVFTKIVSLKLALRISVSLKFAPLKSSPSSFAPRKSISASGCSSRHLFHAATPCFKIANCSLFAILPSCRGEKFFAPT